MSTLPGPSRTNGSLHRKLFSGPRRECKLDAIAMIKKSSKAFYGLDGKRMSIKQIFASCKKRRGRSKYLLSVDVMLADRGTP